MRRSEWVQTHFGAFYCAFCNGYQVEFSCHFYEFCHLSTKCHLQVAKSGANCSKMNKSCRKVLQHRRNQRILFVLLFLQLQEVNQAFWVHPINLLRKEKGEFYNLYPDLWHFPKKFAGMYRMSVEKFEELLQLLYHQLKRKWTYMREPISPEPKLVLTIR